MRGVLGDTEPEVAILTHTTAKGSCNQFDYELVGQPPMPTIANVYFRTAALIDCSLSFIDQCL